MGPETCVRAVSGLSACVPDWEGDSDPGGGHLRGRGRKAAPRDRVLVGKCILRPSPVSPRLARLPVIFHLMLH